MIVRSMVKLLLHLGNYSNITLESEVSLDTNSSADLAKAEEVAGRKKIKFSDAPTFGQLSAVTREMVLEQIQEQKTAINELDAEFFSKK